MNIKLVPLIVTGLAATLLHGCGATVGANAGGVVADVSRSYGVEYTPPPETTGPAGLRMMKDMLKKD